jgi:ribose transport system ATP-binding protein
MKMSADDTSYGRPGSDAPTAPRSPALSIRAVSKRFGATRALTDVGFDVQPGTIHALCGANGSGKSTLIKILTGVIHADPGGAVTVARATVDAAAMTSSRARALGIRVVHQDLGVFSSMSVDENLCLGTGFSHGLAGRIRWGQVSQHCAQLLDRYAIPASGRARMDTLSHAVQTQIAIARSLQDITPGTAAVLILDEPTTAFAQQEVQTLFAAMRGLARQGHAIIFVSHRLDEIRTVADSVTVLRDGRCSGTWDLEALSADELIELIVGAPVEVAHKPDRPRRDQGVPVLEVDGLAVGPLVDISITVRQGEIVGIAGLLGSGRTELLESIHGKLGVTAGRVRLNGEDISALGVTGRRNRGVGFIPENRSVQALFSGMSITANLTAPSVGRYWLRGRISRRRMREVAGRLVKHFNVRSRSPDQPVDSLSGGNQQKVVLARWLHLQPRLLLLDEPTQGVDIGSRADIYRHIRTAVDDGAAAILVTSDFEELSHNADRVLILKAGRLTTELNGDEMRPSAIAESVYLQEGIAG